jgi:replicative DNA helicase
LTILADVDAERAVLGAVLIDPAVLEQAAAVIQPRHMADERHRLIFGAMLALQERGTEPDAVSVMGEMRTGGNVEAAGGMPYLAGLTDGMPRVSSVETWARAVRDRARRRAALELAHRFAAQLEADGAATDAVLEGMRASLERLAEAGERGIRSIADVVPEAIRDLEAFVSSPRGMQGVPTGLGDLDRLTSGMRGGALWIVAARPARGKSALCTQIAAAAAAEGKRVLLFSMEMPPPDVVQRMLLSRAGCSKYELRQQESAWAKVSAAAGQVGELPIWFDGRESPTVGEVRAAARRHKAGAGLDLVVVDYLQRLSVDTKADRWLAVGDSVRALKSLARQLGVPVLAACQLNSDGEDRRPSMANLAQSAGIISAEADLIGFLHPKDLNEWRDGSVQRPTVNLHVDKHRGGPVAEIPLIFERAATRFYGVADRDDWRGERA